MSVGLSLGAGLAIAGGLGAAGSIGGALISSNAAGDATAAQTNAANQGIDLVNKNTGTANDLLKSIYGDQLSTLQPYLTTGTTALDQLNGLTAPGGQLNKPFSFDVTQDPGYQFRLQQGTDAIQNAAAAKGGLLTGGVLKSLTNYGQGFASNEYQNAFARNETQNNDLFSRLNGLATLGFGGASTAVGAAGAYGSGVNSNLQNNSNNLTGLITGKGNAQAAGDIAAGNAWGNGLSGATNGFAGGLTQLNLLNQLTGGGNGGTMPVWQQYAKGY